VLIGLPSARIGIAPESGASCKIGSSVGLPPAPGEDSVMFRVLAKRVTTCDGVSRRSFLTAGSLAALGLAPRAPAAAARGGFGRVKRCLLLFLTRGPPQHDPSDPKPAAPGDPRRELRPFAPSVRGARVGELFPRLARHADKYCVVRSVTHADTVHTSAGYTMLTGVPHPRANSATAALI